MSDRPVYRIRWAKVQGPWDGTRLMCMAEKHVRVLGLFPIWWSIANWRYHEAECERDIAYDQSEPPPAREVRP